MVEIKSNNVEMSEHENAPSMSAEAEPAKPALEDDGVLRGFQANTSSLPAGYYRSPSFIGIMFATGLGLASGVGGYAFAAPELGAINAELGPDPEINWVPLAYTLTLAVGLLLVGRLSDLFGRRWFFILGALLGVIGCIVAATARTIQSLIGATVLLGFASATQLSTFFVFNELVPMKYRYLANGWLYVFTLPISGFAPAISKAFILYTEQGWRWCYWVMLVLNATSGVLYFFFYYPPEFHHKFRNRTKMQQLREFDWIGCLLFTAGLLLFVMGLSWGGVVYPWNSAHVISTTVVGGVTLVAFFLYESFAPLKEPVVPMHLFKNVPWVAATILLALGASIYYAMAILWPSMVGIVYTDGPTMKAGWLNCLAGAMIVTGQMAAGLFAPLVGKTKLQCIAAFTIGGALLAAMASCNPDTLTQAAVLMSLSGFFIGWNESVCLANAGIEVDDQQEIGTAVGMAGSIRSGISTICSAVYIAVLSNRTTETVSQLVPSAVINAGLPEDSVPDFLGGLTTGNFTGVQGLTDDIAVAGAAAFKEANSQAFSTVFLVSIAFSGIAVVLSFWSPNVDDKMTDEVAAVLQQGSDTVLDVAEKKSSMHDAQA